MPKAIVINNANAHLSQDDNGCPFGGDWCTHDNCPTDVSCECEFNDPQFNPIPM